MAGRSANAHAPLRINGTVAVEHGSKGLDAVDHARAWADHETVGVDGPALAREAALITSRACAANLRRRSHTTTTTTISDRCLRPRPVWTPTVRRHGHTARPPAASTISGTHCPATNGGSGLPGRHRRRGEPSTRSATVASLACNPNTDHRALEGVVASPTARSWRRGRPRCGSMVTTGRLHPIAACLVDASARQRAHPAQVLRQHHRGIERPEASTSSVYSRHRQATCSAPVHRWRRRRVRGCPGPPPPPIGPREGRAGGRTRTSHPPADRPDPARSRSPSPTAAVTPLASVQTWAPSSNVTVRSAQQAACARRACERAWRSSRPMQPVRRCP